MGLETRIVSRCRVDDRACHVDADDAARAGEERGDEADPDRLVEEVGLEDGVVTSREPTGDERRVDGVAVAPP
jgi:hypothetical protein